GTTAGRPGRVPVPAARVPRGGRSAPEATGSCGRTIRGRDAGRSGRAPGRGGTAPVSPGIEGRNRRERAGAADPLPVPGLRLDRDPVLHGGDPGRRPGDPLGLLAL